jgi:DNA-binding CsgD family transcriptional regulator
VSDVSVPSPRALHTASAAELKERLEAEHAGRPFLLYRDGRGAQAILTLTAERVSVGRRAEADLALEWDHEVSRLHAVLERVAGEWTVEDDGLSANGTWLGSDRLSGRRRLGDGDVLRFGRTLVMFCDPASMSRSRTAKGDDLASVARLSEGQHRVLVALCRPFRGGGEYASPATNQEIASELYLSVDAVKTHLRTLFVKFGIEHLPQNQKRLQLVERALRSGLVSERDWRG